MEYAYAAFSMGKWKMGQVSFGAFVYPRTVHSNKTVRCSTTKKSLF